MHYDERLEHQSHDFSSLSFVCSSDMLLVWTVWICCLAVAYLNKIHNITKHYLQQTSIVIRRADHDAQNKE